MSLSPLYGWGSPASSSDEEIARNLNHRLVNTDFVKDEPVADNDDIDENDDELQNLRGEIEILQKKNEMFNEALTKAGVSLKN